MAFNLPTITPTALPINLLIKIGVLVLLGLFSIFLVVLIKQVQSLNKIVTENIYGALLQGISVLLLISAIILFIAAYMLL